MGTQSNENFDFDLAPRAGTYQPICFGSCCHIKSKSSGISPLYPMLSIPKIIDVYTPNLSYENNKKKILLATIPLPL